MPYPGVMYSCQMCHGTGQVIEKPCSKCRGQGRIREEKTLQIRIPPGVDNGTKLRVSGNGGAGLRGGPAGDLYIFFHVRPSSIFQREGDDLLCEVPIPFAVAVAGGVVEVPTISGRTKLKIPAGTQSGSVLRLKGKGAPSLRGGARGNLHLRILVESPVGLNSEQLKLLDAFNASLTAKNNPRQNNYRANAGKFLRGDD